MNVRSTTRHLGTPLGPSSHPHHSPLALVCSAAHRPTLFRSRLHWMNVRSTTRHLGTPLDPSSHPHHSPPVPGYPAAHRPTLFRSRLHWMNVRSTTRHLGTPLGPSSRPRRSLLEPVCLGASPPFRCGSPAIQRSKDKPRPIPVNSNVATTIAIEVYTRCSFTSAVKLIGSNIASC